MPKSGLLPCHHHALSLTCHQPPLVWDPVVLLPMDKGRPDLAVLSERVARELTLMAPRDGDESINWRCPVDALLPAPATREFFLERLEVSS